MSEIVYENNSYVGELNPEIFTPLLLPKGGIADRGLVTVRTGIKKRELILDLDVDIEFQEPSAKFVDDELDIRQNESYLDPVGYEVMKELNYKKVIQSWKQSQVPQGSLKDYEPPKELDQFVNDRMTEKIGIANEELYMMGKSKVTAATVSFAGAYPGILPRLEAHNDTKKYSIASIPGVAKTIAGITTANPGTITFADPHGLSDGQVITLTGTNGNQQVGGVSIEGQSFAVIVIDNTTVSIGKQITGVTAATEGKAICVTPDNVVAVLTHGYQTIEERIRNQPDFKLMIPTHIGDAYKLKQSMVANGSGSFTVGDRVLDFLGRKLEEMPYFQKNAIAGWCASNVFLGLDLTSDEETLESIYLGKTTLDQVVRYKAAMKSDINAKFFADCYWLR